MANKEVSFSVDLEELDRQLEERRDEEEREEEQKDLSVRSTVFVLGQDPRVASKKPISAPDLFLLEIEVDRLSNPYVELNWRVPRGEIDSGRIVGFNVFRRRMADAGDSSFKGTRTFNIDAINRIARRIPRRGKFFSERKAIYHVKRGSVPLDILNPNLAALKREEQSNLFKKDVSIDAPVFEKPDFERFFNRRRFEKLAYVDYTKFAQEEKKRFLVVKDRNFIDLNYKDKKVGYSETFEYYIQPVSKELERSPRSNIVKVTVEDLNAVNPPTSLLIKQVDESQALLSVCMEPNDHIARITVWRRSEEEIAFEKLAEETNITDCVNVLDYTIEYGKTYTYRVFLENIHGNLSEPGEIKFTSSVQKITPQSRSNSLKIPIINAVQDQNSDFIRVAIYPNDPNVAYYELKRRDLTIKERGFTVPSQLETGYGGNGWQSDKFFVPKQRISLSEAILNTKTVLDEIIFIDDTISPDHIYTYRTRGYDLFGNPTPYAFDTVRASGKKAIRTPINIKSEVLRGNPYRVKITWDDDNLASENTPEELFSGSTDFERIPNKVVYRILRRKLDESAYESFPLTANKFIIDEVATVDAVNFEGKLIEDVFARLSSSQPEDENFSIQQDELRRSFNLPNFLKINDVYFYRIIAVADNGEESNASEEFRLVTVPELSDPLNFGAEVTNMRVKPLSVRLFWEVDPQKATPDNWLLERKIDSPNDSFTYLGKAYLLSEFVDRHVEPGNTYIYRVKAFDVLGRESGYFETRITL